MKLQRMTGAQLNALFRGTSAPHPLPEGFLRGRILTAVFDPYGTFVGELCRFWLGKRFRGAAGMNVVMPGARSLLRTLAFSQPLEPAPDGSLEGFPFAARRDKGGADPDIEVVALDYGIASNPSPLLRRLRDEVVQVEVGVYLGKILYRVGKSYRPVGFFSLEV